MNKNLFISLLLIFCFTINIFAQDNIALDELYTEPDDKIVSDSSQPSKKDVNVPKKQADEISGDEFLNMLELDSTNKQSAKEQEKVQETKQEENKETIEKVQEQTNQQEENVSNFDEAVKQIKDENDKSYLDTTLPSGITTKLPFSSQLQLSGRKLIGMKYEGVIYDKEESGKRTNSSSFSMEQELQMKIKGTVGDRLSINVDFDDTQDDKRDISIVYKGKGNEFVKEAAFGDISVNLPSTEFSGYSKELFGAKIDTQYKGLKTNAFFSKTKGYSENKRFKGSAKREKKTIPDTAYVRYKYYNLLNTGETRKIKNNTAVVYLDKGKVSATDYIIIDINTELKYLKSTSEVYKGNFIKLTAGTDYTINYNTGIITFKSALVKDYVVAVDYQFEDGTWLSSGSTTPLDKQPLIIKDTNNTNLTTELYTYYNLGNYNITKYNGRNNFILECRDLSGTVPASLEGGKKVPKYPNIEGYEANITVDFDNGIFNLQPIDGRPMHDDLYTEGTHKYNFVVEYEYKVKIFNLRTGIVPMSEKVKIDGKTLKINEDYMMDYDVGILTILKDDLIQDNSTIDVSYDYSPFGSSSADSTMVGFRTQYNFTDNIFIGGSLIYEFASESSKLPDLYSTPSSTLVGEIDAQVKDLEITDTLKLSASAEYAKSQYIKNTTGQAIIESMEGAKQEDSVSLIDDNWFYSSTPDTLSTKYNLDCLTWRNYDIEKKEIDPGLEITEGERQQVMDLEYDLTSYNNVSIAQTISSAGYDFTEKLYIEMWIKADFNNLTIQLDYASNINEDSDRNNVLSTEDTNGDGILSPWEDVGRDFVNPDSSVSKIGANNGRLDTEDINTNNYLDRFDSTSINSFILDKYSPYVDITKSKQWQKIQIPLDITDATRDRWRNIRVARITVSGSTKGVLTIGKVSVIGNKWVKDATNESNIEISSIGKDDAGYVSLLNNSYFRELYDLDSNSRRDEQALRLKYKDSSNEELYAKTTYSSAIDISDYKEFKFFVYIQPKTSSSPDTTNFVMRIGGSKDDYFQYTMPITDDMRGSWKIITIKQDGYGVKSSWVSGDNGGTIETKGSPTLQHISFIETGVKTPSSVDEGEIWVNEIHVKGAKSKDGSAWKTDVRLKWDGTDTFGGVDLNAYRKSIDQDFETFAPGTYDREYHEDVASVKFDGVKVDETKVLPIYASLTKTKGITPAAIDNTSDTVSILDEGTVVTYTGQAQTVLTAGQNTPKITVEYKKYIKDTQEKKELEDVDTISTNLTYQNPLDNAQYLPTNITADYKVSNSAFKVYPDQPIKDTDTFLDLQTMKEYMDIEEYQTLEKTETIALSLPFNFYNKVSFSPGYALTKVSEKNKRDFENTEVDYNKSLNQDIGAKLNFTPVKWFQPNVVYNVSTIETYDLDYSTSTAKTILPGQEKTIDRTATTEITWNIQAKDVYASKYLRSLIFTTSYRLQDTDSYQNMDKNFSSTGLALDKIWIRNNLLQEKDSPYLKKALNRDDIRFIGRYNPFEAFNLNGMLMPIKTMTMSFTYTQGNENGYDTGTRKETFSKTWPDLLIGMTRFEKLFNVSWISDTQLNLKHYKQTNTTYGVSYGDSTYYGGDYRFKIFKKYDILFEANTLIDLDYDIADKKTTNKGETINWAIQCARDVKQWRMNLRYENMQLWAKNYLGVLSDQVYSNKITYQVTSDLMFPSGIKLPFLGVVPLKNRIKFDSNCFYNKQTSDVNIEENNLQTFGFDIAADYEMSRYLKCTLQTALTRYLYTYVPEKNYILLELAAKLTIQF